MPAESLDATFANRRAAERIPFRLPVRITIYPPASRESDTARYVHVLADNLSGDGVSIIYARKLMIGQRLEIEMPDRPRSAKICRVDATRDGLYTIGCRFTDGHSSATPPASNDAL